MKSSKPWRRIIEAEAHHHLATALVAGVAVFAWATRFFNLPVSLAISWDAFAVVNLLLSWGGMMLTGARTRVREARLQDSNRVAIACCLIVAALVSLLAAGVLLGTAKSLKGNDLVGHVSLAAGTVICSWLMVHTLLAVHYTHLFYSGTRGEGLEFPEEKAPDFVDFAYFSFVVGMTFQVSDVQVTSRQMRRVVLLHSLLSFAFNTIIVAFSINLATTLL